MKIHVNKSSLIAAAERRKHPVTGQNMKPKFLGGIEPETKSKDRRAVVAEWIASADNPYFAKNLSNIVWAHFLGKGIVDEVDDVRVSNPAVNPQLLDELGTKFKEYNYDFKNWFAISATQEPTS